MTGLRPIHIVRQTVAGVRSGMSALREWQLKRRLRKSDLKGQLEISQRELAKQQRVIEKQLKKQGAPVPEPAGGICFAGGIGESAEAESGRYHGAAG